MNDRTKISKAIAAVLTAFTLLLLTVALWHLLAPAGWRWLGPEDIYRLDFVAGSFVCIAAVGYAAWRCKL